MNDSDERSRVALAQTGDRDAFSALVDAYWGRLFRWLFGITRRHHLAEDIAQETFLQAWVGLPSLKTGGNFRVWLFRIAHNCLANRFRGPRGLEPKILPQNLPAVGPGPLAEMIQNEGVRQIQEALDRAPEDHRAAYLLTIHEELAYPEIAEILAITEVQARWRVFKARQFLAKELTKDNGH